MFDPEKDAQAEQLLKEYRRVIPFIESNRAALEAKGVNVDEQLAQLRKDSAELERINSATEDAEQGFLQAAANLADKEFDVFRETSRMVDHLLASNPEDPRVQELLRKREELKKHFPESK